MSIRCLVLAMRKITKTSLHTEFKAVRLRFTFTASRNLATEWPSMFWFLYFKSKTINSTLDAYSKNKWLFGFSVAKHILPLKVFYYYLFINLWYLFYQTCSTLYGVCFFFAMLLNSRMANTVLSNLEATLRALLNLEFFLSMRQL